MSSGEEPQADHVGLTWGRNAVQIPTGPGNPTSLHVARVGEIWFLLALTFHSFCRWYRVRDATSTPKSRKRATIHGDCGP